MAKVLISLVVAFTLIIFLLKKRVRVGPSVLSGGFLIWLINSFSFPVMGNSIFTALTSWKTWDIILCLYFVMCLEAQLRLSGTFKKLSTELHNIFASNKVSLAVMPAVLGLLPSLGGARFSAPIVLEVSEGVNVSKEAQAVINYWFRHIFEFSSPLVPGLILACAIAEVSIGDVIIHLFWLTLFCGIFGWFYLVHRLTVSEEIPTAKASLRKVEWSVIFLTLGPIVLTFILTLTLGISASAALGISVLSWFPMLALFNRKTSLVEVLKSAFDLKLNIDVICIMIFIQILTQTGFLKSIEGILISVGWAPEIIVACLAFLTGVMTGFSQAYIAMTIPVAAMLAPGNLDVVAIALVFGMAGQMMTPTHLCALISLDYFQANAIIFARKVLVLTGGMLFVYIAITTLQKLLM